MFLKKGFVVFFLFKETGGGEGDKHGALFSFSWKSNTFRINYPDAAAAATTAAAPP